MPEEVRKDSSYSLWKEETLLTLEFQTSSLPSYERRNTCYFKPPRLWSFVVAARKNQNRDLDNFEECYWVFCKMSISLGLSHDYTALMDLGEEYQTGEGRIIPEGT